MSVQYTYKVEYLDVALENSKWYDANREIDKATLSQRLEGLLNEYAKLGYEVDKIVPLINPISVHGQPSSMSSSLLVTFRKEEV